MNQNGVLGINCIIHDSDYFQEFSYEIHSEIPSQRFNSIVDDLIHPTGLKRFNVYHNEFVGNIPNIENSIEIIKLVNHSLPSVNFSHEQISLANFLSATLNLTKNFPAFVINNIDRIKFSSNFNYKIKDFENLKISYFSSENIDQRTLDPEITVT